MKKLFYLIVCYFLVPVVFAQPYPQDLSKLLETGEVEIVFVTGNGSSSGAALDGVILSNQPRVIRVSTILNQPIYFQNENSTAQNMIGTQVFSDDGGYFIEGNSSFIEIPPNQSIRVMFVAYCADYEKDNPSSNNNFTIVPLPEDLQIISRRIVSYEASNTDTDVTVAVQLALWLSQGESLENIQQKYEFNNNDVNVAKQIMGQ